MSPAILLALTIVCSCRAMETQAQEADDRAARMRTWVQIQRIGGGLRKVSDREGQLPYPSRRAPYRRGGLRKSPNGTGPPLYSWRFSIIWAMLLEYDGNDKLTWDSPGNRDALEVSFLYSYENADTWIDRGQLFPETNIFAITGPGTAFGDGDSELPACLAEVPSSAVIAVEVRASGVPWPAPGDFDIRTMPRTINAPDGMGISSRHAGGFHVVFADAHAWFLSDRVPFETLERLFTIAGARANDREELLGAYAIDKGPRNAQGEWTWDVPRDVVLKPMYASEHAWKVRGEAEWKKVLASGWKSESESLPLWLRVAAGITCVSLVPVTLAILIWRKLHGTPQEVKTETGPEGSEPNGE